MPAIRDPVHSWIRCSIQEQAIIDSPLFQRLHWVSQCTSVKQVFPGGVHTRFLHSLGVMKLSGSYMHHLLGTKFPIGSKTETYIYQLTRLAGLLHDIGHGPFSHAYDRTIYQKIYGIPDGGHDCHRLIMVKSDMLAPLIKDCGIDPSDLIAVWNPDSQEFHDLPAVDQQIFTIIKAVVQGPLGADRMDFTLRDSYFTGTTHLGTIASARIISNTKILPGPEGNYCLHYHFKCLSDIIRALDGRYYMYDSVYLHKTVSAAGLLIEKMLYYSAEYLQLYDKTNDLSEFQWLNDSMIIGSILSYSGTDQNMLLARANCHKFLQRKLPKLLSESTHDYQTPFEPDAIRTQYSQTHGIPAEKLIIIRTRAINGIDPKKWEKCQIRFWTPQETFSCETALQKIQYQNQTPHYIVRIYHEI